MKLKHFLLLAPMLAATGFAYAQKKKVPKDTVVIKVLDPITVTTILYNSAPSYLADVVDNKIYAGKKTQTFDMDGTTANLGQNVARQALARIPGLVIWDMDGAGTQVNIGTRSTDSHRSIEMNMRQNGYNTNSDIFGYPENHFSVPMQAVSKIQYVRGSAALQFGPQFGGMMNYEIKKGDSTRPVAIESEQTVGSNGFVNSYNAIGGTSGKWNYYAYFDTRHGNGWRPDQRFDYHAYYLDLNYKIDNRGSIGIQFSRMDYLQQIAGGLTDAMFNQQAQQSTRTRNFFTPEINIPAITFKYQLGAQTFLQVQANAIFGQRNSVQFINTPNIKDTFNTSIGSYNPRQVDRDYYSGFASEARLTHYYRLGGFMSTLATGIRVTSEQTLRKQKGVGTTGEDADLTLVKPYGIDLKLRTTNYAAFAENMFQLTRHFSVTPGVRFENIKTTMDGVINNASTAVYYASNRTLPLFGVGLQYNISKNNQLYGNITQAYRPYLYASVTPATQVDQIDPNLKDSKGYDIDLGWRGHYSDIIRYDVNLYYLYYGNRVGLISQKTSGGTSYLLTTNIGNSVAKGVEALIDVSIPGLFNASSRITDLRLFTALAYDHARYTSGTLNKAGTNVSIEGNYVENTPEWISKTGLRFQYRNFSTSVQYSYNSQSYSDALNTPGDPTGVIGLIPAWHVWDWSADFRPDKRYHISAGINNFTNVMYFNRRINMYPGPGILPADGRTFYITFGVNL